MAQLTPPRPDHPTLPDALHTAIRYILQGLDPGAVEAAFRRHAALLQAARTKPGTASIALDGKTLRGSFDRFHDRTAAHVLSAFATDTMCGRPLGFKGTNERRASGRKRSCVRPVGAASWPLAQMESASKRQTSWRPDKVIGINGMSCLSVRPTFISGCP
ncbi:hypothetical protein [Acidiphilium sp. PM]|uniref:hypothetical protein n=1 Tax=Acidiphilium sp. PM TaxID=1043206 RepID=UPI0006813CA1|nr:hypothetical protein [Acidiphilium sp. PM]